MYVRMNSHLSRMGTCLKWPIISSPYNYYLRMYCTVRMMKTSGSKHSEVSIYVAKVQ